MPALCRANECGTARAQRVFTRFTLRGLHTAFLNRPIDACLYRVKRNTVKCCSFIYVEQFWALVSTLSMFHYYYPLKLYIFLWSVLADRSCFRMFCLSQCLSSTVILCNFSMKKVSKERVDCARVSVRSR